MRVSQTERQRQELLEQLNNQGRILEREEPALASELNKALRKLLAALAQRRVARAKGSGR
jgi:hypothetical protein